MNVVETPAALYCATDRGTAETAEAPAARPYVSVDKWLTDTETAEAPAARPYVSVDK